jgi:hypothetical protein
MLPLTQILIHSSFISFYLFFFSSLSSFFFLFSKSNNNNNKNKNDQKLGYEMFPALGSCFYVTVPSPCMFPAQRSWLLCDNFLVQILWVFHGHSDGSSWFIMI